MCGSDISLPSNISSISRLPEEKRQYFIQRAHELRKQYHDRYVKQTKKMLDKKTSKLQKKVSHFDL